MSLLALFALAVSVSMDAFAVCVVTGMQLRSAEVAQKMRMAAAFGAFQFLMPLIGWMLGVGVRRWIEHWDHWVAFGLLAFVGANMLYEGWTHDAKGTSHAPRKDPTKGWPLLLLAIATSIDALAVGLSFSLLKMTLPVWLACLSIGIVCTAISAMGMQLGGMLAHAHAVAKRAEMLGGLILIAIGLRILCQHGVF